jgi:adenine C2-methylase RlmN of 23S rRNA A2503 and tRNA A37
MFGAHVVNYSVNCPVTFFMQVGIIHAINRFKDDLPNVNLAVSLHAPDQDIRCQIMPAARAFPLEKLMNALQSYQNER